MNSDNKPSVQIEKFKEAARELETDDDEQRFVERLKMVAKRRLPNKTGKA